LINVPSSPGIGFEVNEKEIEALAKRSEEIFLGDV